MAESLPVAVLLGVYLGLLAGIIPALIAAAMGFLFKYLSGVTAPGFGIVVLAVAVAGANGGFMALNDPAVRSSPTLVTALIVVMMLSLYAHNEGDKLGATLPRRLPWRKLRPERLSADVVDLVGGRGQVRVSVVGDVADMEGYPPLPADLRATIRAGTWTFPADLPLSELETRLAERLRTDHDLAEVVVSIDERGQATVAAAPPASGLSRRVPAGKRAVTLRTLVPTGVARGEQVRIRTAAETIDGTVVSAASSVSGDAAPQPPQQPPAPDASPGEDDAPALQPAPTAPTTSGGDGRLTVAVDRSAAERLLDSDIVGTVIRSRGTRREFELVALLRRAGKRFRRLTLTAGSTLAGQTLGEATLRDTHGVAIMALRRRTAADDSHWLLAPQGSVTLQAGDDLFVVGPRDALDRFAEVSG
jgi:hypothetical protein